MCTFVFIYQFYFISKSDLENQSSNFKHNFKYIDNKCNFTRCFNEDVNVSNYISGFKNLKNETYEIF